MRWQIFWLIAQNLFTSYQAICLITSLKTVYKTKIRGKSCIIKKNMFDKKKKHDREFYSQTYWLKTNPTRSDHLTSTSRYFCNLQATMEHRQYENNLLKYTFEFIILSLYVSWFHYWSFLMWNTFGLSHILYFSFWSCWLFVMKCL